MGIGHLPAEICWYFFCVQSTLLSCFNNLLFTTGFAQFYVRNSQYNATAKHCAARTQTHNDIH